MINFKRTRVTLDNKHLLIDIEVADFEYYNNIMIDSIYIENLSTFNPEGPTSNPIYKTSNIDARTFHLVYEIEESTPNLFFIWVLCKGYLAPDTPCGMKDKLVLCVVYNGYWFFNNGISYLREMLDTCTPPRNFIDYILRERALRLAIETGNYTLAIKYWNWFFNKLSNTVNSKINHKCGCHA